MGFVVYFVYNAFDGFAYSGSIYEAVYLFISVGLGALIYSILIYFLKIEEVDWIIRIVKNRFSPKPKIV